jgi:hypothetical protein
MRKWDCDYHSYDHPYQNSSRDHVHSALLPHFPDGETESTKSPVICARSPRQDMGNQDSSQAQSIVPGHTCLSGGGQEDAGELREVPRPHLQDARVRPYPLGRCEVVTLKAASESPPGTQQHWGGKPASLRDKLYSLPASSQITTPQTPRETGHVTAGTTGGTGDRTLSVITASPSQPAAERQGLLQAPGNLSTAPHSSLTLSPSSEPQSGVSLPACHLVLPPPSHGPPLSLTLLICHGKGTGNTKSGLFQEPVSEALRATLIEC